MRRFLAWCARQWHNLGPWEGDNMDEKPPPIVIIVTHAPRAIGHIEADLVIQGVLVRRARERKSYTLAEEQARLDALIDEWATATRRASLESL